MYQWWGSVETAHFQGFSAHFQGFSAQFQGFSKIVHVSDCLWVFSSRVAGQFCLWAEEYDHPAVTPITHTLALA